MNKTTERAKDPSRALLNQGHFRMLSLDTCWAISQDPRQPLSNRVLHLVYLHCKGPTHTARFKKAEMKAILQVEDEPVINSERLRLAVRRLVDQGQLDKGSTTMEATLVKGHLIPRARGRANEDWSEW